MRSDISKQTKLPKTSVGADNSKRTNSILATILLIRSAEAEPQTMLTKYWPLFPYLFSPTAGGLFGSSFGTTTGAAAPAFGSTMSAPAFGSAPTAFGATTTTAAPTLGGGFSGFGAAAAPTSQPSLFGTPAISSAPPAFSGFGQSASTAPASGFGGFGATTTTAPTFGGFGTTQSTPFGGGTFASGNYPTASHSLINWRICYIYHCSFWQAGNGDSNAWIRWFWWHKFYAGTTAAATSSYFIGRGLCAIYSQCFDLWRWTRQYCGQVELSAGHVGHRQTFLFSKCCAGGYNAGELSVPF